MSTQAELPLFNKEKGYFCPCCGLFVKQYTRKLNSSMAMVLILIFRSGKKDFFHVENWLDEIGKPELRADFHKLVHWDLLEKKDGKRDDGSNRNGFYRITTKGRGFALNEFEVAEKAIIFNNKLIKFKGPGITIEKALGNKFNYNELMTYKAD